jgi:hypothetical protein
LLLFQRTVDQDGDRFTTIGATDDGFLQQVHTPYILYSGDFGSLTPI